MRRGFAFIFPALLVTVNMSCGFGAMSMTRVPVIFVQRKREMHRARRALCHRLRRKRIRRELRGDETNRKECADVTGHAVLLTRRSGHDTLHFGKPGNACVIGLHATRAPPGTSVA